MSSEGELDLHQMLAIKFLADAIEADKTKFEPDDVYKTGEVKLVTDEKIDIPRVPAQGNCLVESLYYGLNLLGANLNFEQVKAKFGSAPAPLALSVVNEVINSLRDLDELTTNIVAYETPKHLDFEFNRQAFTEDRLLDQLKGIADHITKGEPVLMGVKDPDGFIDQRAQEEEIKSYHVVTVVGFELTKDNTPVFHIYDNRIAGNRIIRVPAKRLIDYSFLGYMYLSVGV